MIYKITSIKDKFVDKIRKNSMKELNKFYGIGWTNNIPNIIVIKNRKDIDLLRNIKTERWVIAWADGRTVFILDRNNFEKESSHKYKVDSYSATIKHELSHCFYSILSERKHNPIWFTEGVAIYTSGQLKFKKKPTKFSNFLSFYKHGGGGVYAESGFFVELLVKKYGKKKLLNLIEESGYSRSEKDFKKIFKRKYGFDLSYKEINKRFIL